MARRRETPWAPPPAPYPGRRACRRCRWHVPRTYLDASRLCFECWLFAATPRRDLAEPAPKTLTAREAEAVAWQAEGLSLRRISGEMGVTPGRVHYLLMAAARKGVSAPVVSNRGSNGSGAATPGHSAVHTRL